MSVRGWALAEKARTLREAHEALVALRPARDAAVSAWVSYYRRSAAVYRQVAEIDRDHNGHALYWAGREQAKADGLASRADTPNGVAVANPDHKRRGKIRERMPSKLEEAHDTLRALQPAEEAGPALWLAYHRHAASVYAEVAEVDRAHHHEALSWAGSERDKASLLTSTTRTVSTVDKEDGGQGRAH